MVASHDTMKTEHAHHKYRGDIHTNKTGLGENVKVNNYTNEVGAVPACSLSRRPRQQD